VGVPTRGVGHGVPVRRLVRVRARVSVSVRVRVRVWVRVRVRVGVKCSGAAALLGAEQA
jgi:hypothetical protein